MKRIFGDQDHCYTVPMENDDQLDENLPKKFKKNTTTCTESSPTMKALWANFDSTKYSLVERNSTPSNHSLVNTEYVGKLASFNDLMELDDNTSMASQRVFDNMKNKMNQLGHNMKYLYGQMVDAYEQSLRDVQLHEAACNFVKVPGHIYHLYERSSGQKYFSMLSPEDWGGNAPHKFLGSWVLETDQSWVPLEEMHKRYEGLKFIQQSFSHSSCVTKCLTGN